MADIDQILAQGSQPVDLGAIFTEAYKIKELQQNQQNTNALKSFFSDPSNLGPDGLPTNNALANLTRVAPQVGFEVTEQTAKVENQRALTDDRTMELKVQKDNILEKGVREPAATAYDNAIKEGKTPEVATQIAQRVYNEGLDTVKQSGEFSAGEVAQFAPNFDIDRIRTASKINALHNQPKSGDVETITDASGNTFDHDKLKGTNKFVSGPAGLKPGEDYDPTGGVHRLAGAADTGGLDQAGIDYYAKLFRTQGPTALGRLTKGDRDKVINAAAGSAGGDAASDIRTQYAGRGAQAEQRAEGTRTGQLRIAEEEMEGAVQLSQNAYDKLPRGSFTPFNELQNLVEKKTSSPEQAAAYAADNAIVNIYARMISPTGQGTDSDKNHAREMLNQAQGPEAHRAVLNQLMAEGKNALAKAQRARAETTEETPVAGEDTPSNPRPHAAAPRGTPPINLLREGKVAHFPNGTKWTLRDGRAVEVN